MDNDRNDRNNRWDNLGYRGAGGNEADRDIEQRASQVSNRGREDYGRRDYGGGDNFYGANRDDYGSRGGSRQGSVRGYNSGQGGGYDEWSLRDDRAFGDQFFRNEGTRGYHGDNDQGRGRSSGGRYGRSGERNYTSQSEQNRWSGDRAYGGGERGSAEGGRGFWDKASDEVSSWFGDRDAERRRESDQHRGRGPKGYTRSDERIRDDVNDRLTDDGWLDASEIEVIVSNREVTLSGTVSDRNAKRRAEDITESVSGVSHVQNNIRVKARNATGTDVDVDRTGDTAGNVKTGAGGMR